MPADAHIWILTIILWVALIIIAITDILDDDDKDKRK